MNQMFIIRLIKTLQLFFIDFRTLKNNEAFINVDPYRLLDVKNEVEVNVIILNKYLLQFTIKYELKVRYYFNNFMSSMQVILFAEHFIFFLRLSIYLFLVFVALKNIKLHIKVFIRFVYQLDLILHVLEVYMMNFVIFYIILRHKQAP